MSIESRYHAPFGPKGSEPIDAETARKLLALALSRGGDYADLFFEYGVAGSYSLEEGILTSAFSALCALRIRVSISATGSVMLMSFYSPRTFRASTLTPAR